MLKDTRKLIAELNRREVPVAIENRFTRGGIEAYNLLKSVCLAETTSAWQVRNALILIVKMRFVGDQGEVFGLLIRSCADKRLKVRSAAAQLLVGLAKISQQGFSTEIAPLPEEALFAIRTAADMGLENLEAEAQVEEFLKSVKRSSDNATG